VAGAVRGLAGLRAITERLPARRTDRDLPGWVVWAGALGLVAACTLTPSLGINVLGALLVLAFGFLFVTVSSRLTGEIGSSSNPISGMTVATLLITSLIFLALGWVSPPHKVAALSVAAIVCIAASNGGTTSQDLKTGYLLGAAPSRQQIAILVGALSSALVIGFVLLKLNDASTVFARRDFPGYRADPTLLQDRQRLRGPDAARDGGEYRVLRLAAPAGGGPGGQVPGGKRWGHPLRRGPGHQRPGRRARRRHQGGQVQRPQGDAHVVHHRRHHVAAAAVGAGAHRRLRECRAGAVWPLLAGLRGGVYLPLSTSAPIMMGGLVRWLAARTGRAGPSEEAAAAESGPGVLFSSGLIAGASVAGMAVAMMQLTEPTRVVLAAARLGGLVPGLAGSDLAAFLLFLGLPGCSGWWRPSGSSGLAPAPESRHAGAGHSGDRLRQGCEWQPFPRSGCAAQAAWYTLGTVGRDLQRERPNQPAEVDLRYSIGR